GAQPVEEGVAGVDALHQPHVAQIALRHDRLGAILGDDRAPAASDLRNRLVPRDALERVAAIWPGALRADAAQRKHETIGIDVVVVEVLELDAQRAASDRVLLVALHVDELAILDLVDHGAGVGTVVWTAPEKRRALDLLVHVSLPWDGPVADLIFTCRR